VEQNQLYPLFKKVEQNQLYPLFKKVEQNQLYPLHFFTPLDIENAHLHDILAMSTSASKG